MLPSWPPIPISGDKNVLLVFLLVQEGYFSHRILMTCFREEEQGKEVRVGFLHLPFSQTPSVYATPYANVPYFGIVCLELHH